VRRSGFKLFTEKRNHEEIRRNGAGHLGRYRHRQATAGHQELSVIGGSMKKHIKLPSMSRVVPGAKAVLELPIGPTYERLLFSVSAAAGLDASDVGRIDVNIDGKTIQTFKNLQRLIDVNGYWGRDADSVAATAMVFAIHFNTPEMESNLMRRAAGIGTSDVHGRNGYRGRCPGRHCYCRTRTDQPGSSAIGCLQSHQRVFFLVCGGGSGRTG
jgi:hypothetical protein